MRSNDVDAILSKVKEILGNREGNYADSRPMFDKIAAMWSAYLGFNITRQDAAYMMELFKIARIKAGKWQPDNGYDNIGYAVLAYVVEALGEDSGELINDVVVAAESNDDSFRYEAKKFLAENYPQILEKNVWDADRFPGAKNNF